MDAIPLPDDLSPITVLIIDARSPRMPMLAESLKRGGYTVITASTEEALQPVLHDRAPNLVIVGGLPGSDAAALCDTIHTSTPDYYLPIIALVDDRANGHLLQVAGANATLHWPVESSAFATWLHYLLRHAAHVNALLEENRRLEAASRSAEQLKREIITSVSHEFRTPLVQIKASVSMLADDVRNHADYPQPSLADMATQAVARLEGVVDTIRQLAQTHNISLGPVIVSEAVDLALRFLARSWNSRGASQRVETCVQPNLPPVLADKRALARLLQLLLDNALKFSPDDSTVAVCAKAEPDHKVRISVQDSGIGIPPDEHTRIFDAFYQIDASDARPYGGTGNGLALAMLLARGMNTDIDVTSLPGTGSTFSFILLAADLEQFSDSPPPRE